MRRFRSVIVPWLEVCGRRRSGKPEVWMLPGTGPTTTAGWRCYEHSWSVSVVCPLDHCTPWHSIYNKMLHFIHGTTSWERQLHHAKWLWDGWSGFGRLKDHWNMLIGWQIMNVTQRWKKKKTESIVDGIWQWLDWKDNVSYIVSMKTHSAWHKKQKTWIQAHHI